MGQAIPAIVAFAASDAGIAIAAATTAASVAYAARSQAQAANYQSRVAANNAQIEEQNRVAAVQEGAAAESMQRTETGRRISSALAAQAANGIDVGFGSAQDVRQGMQLSGDLDAETIRYRAMRGSLGSRNTQAGLRADSKMYKAQATNAYVGGALDIGSSFLSTANSVQRRKTSEASVGGTSSTPKG